MAKTKRREIGDAGEGVVCRYLEERGYTVLEKNYWKPWGEIDIVAEQGKTLIFVEVKSVSREINGGEASRGTYRPEENMHPAKIKRLHRAIQTYLLERNVPEGRQWRLDLACVFLDFATRKAKVELLENVM